MKKYKFFDGSSIMVPDNTCRGCYLETTDEVPVDLRALWSNKNFTIRQDAECPVPGFYILAARKHIHSIGDLNIKEAGELGIIVNRLRFNMKKALNIQKVHVFLEEKLVEPHLHIWLLPLWPEVMKKNDIDPKIWNSNILQYLNLFKYEENSELINEYNNKIELALASDMELKKLI